jgi:hypothetical protein
MARLKNTDQCSSANHHWQCTNTVSHDYLPPQVAAKARQLSPGGNMTRQTLRDNRWLIKVVTPTPKIEKITTASTAEKMVEYASRQLAN